MMAACSSMLQRRRRERLQRVASHVVTPTEHLSGHHPRPSRPESPLRSFTAAEIQPDDDRNRRTAASGVSEEAVVFPGPLPSSHPAVQCFREQGYVAIPDACGPEALARTAAAFDASIPRAEAVWRVALELDEQLSQSEAAHYFDLPREDMTPSREAWESGAWGGFLVTERRHTLDAFMQVLANQRVLALLEALLGPDLHLMEAAGRVVLARPPAEALEHGGYTDWHRDVPSGVNLKRVKCICVLKDTPAAGGPLGLMPRSHLWPQDGPPSEYRRGGQGMLPGHVKAALPAGGMVLFDYRAWHTGMPLTNGRDRHNLVCTFGSPHSDPHTEPHTDPHLGAGKYEQADSTWPVGGYGGEPTASGFARDFLECGMQLERRGWLDTPVRRQLFGVELSSSGISGAFK